MMKIPEIFPVLIVPQPTPSKVAPPAAKPLATNIWDYNMVVNVAVGIPMVLMVSQPLMLTVILLATMILKKFVVEAG